MALLHTNSVNPLSRAVSTCCRVRLGPVAMHAIVFNGLLQRHLGERAYRTPRCRVNDGRCRAEELGGLVELGNPPLELLLVVEPVLMRPEKMVAVFVAHIEADQDESEGEDE